MTRLAKEIIIGFSIVALLIAGGLYLFHYFFSAFAPPKIKITERYISTNHDFINGVTIEQIDVDSLGAENYPLKYTVTYWTTCSMIYPGDRPPNPPSKIHFNKGGKYYWTEEFVHFPFIHKGLSRYTADSTNRILCSIGDKKFKTCPLTFEKGQWYFFNTYDPAVTGIFFFIDQNGEEKQYYLASGVSPI